MRHARVRDVFGRRGQPWLAPTVLIVGAALTVFAVAMVDNYLERAAITDAARAGDHAAAAVRLTLDRAAIAVRAVRAIYATGAVTDQQFQRFADTLFTTNGATALGFVRRVADADRATYEAALTASPANMIGIWQADANGKPVRAPQKPAYFVLEATLVPNGTPRPYGFDVSSLSDRVADMQRALDRSELTMTQEIPLAAQNDVGVTLFDPVADQNGRPIGVAAGSISHRTIVGEAAEASGVSDIALEVGPPGSGDGTDPDVTAANGDARTFAFADRLITVMVDAPVGAGGRPWLDLLVAALGAAATLAAVAGLFNLQKARALLIAEGRQRAMLDGLGPIALLLAPDGTVVNANRAAVATFNRAEKEMLHRPFEELLAGADADERERVDTAVAAARRGEDVRFDLPIETTQGRQVFDLWIRRKELTGNLVASAVDVTDRYEAEETQRLLMRELDHRMKNALQVIQAIIRRTAASHESIAEFEHALLGRVAAMSRAHELLASERWHGADLAAVVRQETEHLGAVGAVSVSGPHVRLSPKAALSLALVIHELATNAVKYGALSTAAGRLTITWDVGRGLGETPALVLNWRETGGPAVKAPKRRGFGSLLVERSIAYELDGSATLDYRPEGLHCIISAPIAAIRPLHSHAPATDAGGPARGAPTHAASTRLAIPGEVVS